MKSNFAFLNSHFPVLANFGELAEKYLYSDSRRCLKIGTMPSGERFFRRTKPL